MKHQSKWDMIRALSWIIKPRNSIGTINPFVPQRYSLSEATLRKSLKDERRIKQLVSVN